MARDSTYDFIVIGAGAAGEAAAHEARRLGASVLVVERELVGGSCPFWACMPSKALLHAAGIHHLGGDYSWRHASNFRDWITSREHRKTSDDSGHIESLEKAGAKVAKGTAQVIGPGSVRISSTGKAARNAKARNLIISVGTHSTVPDLPGIDKIKPWTNREATSTRSLPKSLLVMGGGPTGVELAGALGEIAKDTLKRDFRSIDPTHSRIILVEAMDRVLPPYPKGRSASARRQLERLGVTVRTGTKVVGLDDRSVDLDVDGAMERLPTRTVLWAAGVQASTFGRVVAEATGAETDRAGRIVVGPDLTLPGHPEIFDVGDVASRTWRQDRSVPGVAQGAIQGGNYAAETIGRRLRGEATPPFRYSNRGEVAIIGRLSGVTDIPWLGPFGRQGGFTAWLLWLGIHISYLIGFSNRLVVVTRWAWSFLTHGRSSRLITGQPLLPPIERPEPPAGSGAAAAPRPGSAAETAPPG